MLAPLTATGTTVNVVVWPGSSEVAGAVPKASAVGWTVTPVLPVTSAAPLPWPAVSVWSPRSPNDVPVQLATPALAAPQLPAAKVVSPDDSAGVPANDVSVPDSGSFVR